MNEKKEQQEIINLTLWTKKQIKWNYYCKNDMKKIHKNTEKQKQNNNLKEGAK